MLELLGWGCWCQTLVPNFPLGVIEFSFASIIWTRHRSFWASTSALNHDGASLTLTNSASLDHERALTAHIVYTGISLNHVASVRSHVIRLSGASDHVATLTTHVIKLIICALFNHHCRTFRGHIIKVLLFLLHRFHNSIPSTFLLDCIKVALELHLGVHSILSTGRKVLIESFRLFLLSYASKRSIWYIRFLFC